MKKFEWIDNQISYVITIGIVGFLFATLLLCGKSCTSEKIGYHEVKISGKDSIVREIYHSRLQSLNDSLSRIYGKNSADMAKWRSELRMRIASQLIDSAYVTNGSADTSDRFYARILSIKPETLRDSIASDYWTDEARKPISFDYQDTSLLMSDTPQILNKAGWLAITQPKTFMEFLRDNPFAGFWLIFSVAQMILWFLVPPLLYGKFSSIQKKIESVENGLEHARNWLISCIIPFLFIGLFAWIFYELLIDEVVIKDHYFLTGFNCKMFWYAIVGYLATVLCFGMYLYLSMVLDRLDKKAIENGLTFANNTELKENYKAVKGVFEGSFLATAFLLSAFVLWLGITFTTINQTEAMRFFKIYSGEEFLNYDFVYLVGFFHTVILLLFYIPVRLKFDSLDVVDQAQAAHALNGNKIFVNLYNGIITLLVTASPLLTSLTQKLLAGFIAD